MEDRSLNLAIPANPPLTLEDQVFGLWLPAPPSPPTEGPNNKGSSSSSAPPRGADLATQYLLPLVVCLVVVLVVLWSLSKSVQYNELFQNNPRYQYGLWTLNIAVVVVAMALVCYIRTGNHVPS